MNLNEFLKSDAAKELADRAKTIKSVEEAMSFAKAQGIEVTEEEVKKFLLKNTSKQKLSESDLDSVTGGEGEEERKGLDIDNNDPRCTMCGGQLVCIDEVGESHGCVWTFSSYQCQSCGQHYDYVWEGSYWRYNY